ncbi:MAG: hypothetical protein ACREGI_05765, partial [Candidatus Levyibacteriota bacterium]
MAKKKKSQKHGKYFCMTYIKIVGGATFLCLLFLGVLFLRNQQTNGVLAAETSEIDRVTASHNNPWCRYFPLVPANPYCHTSMTVSPTPTPHQETCTPRLVCPPTCAAGKICPEYACFYTKCPTGTPTPRPTHKPTP